MLRIWLALGIILGISHVIPGQRSASAFQVLAKQAFPVAANDQDEAPYESEPCGDETAEELAEPVNAEPIVPPPMRVSAHTTVVAFLLAAHSQRLLRPPCC